MARERDPKVAISAVTICAFLSKEKSLVILTAVNVPAFPLSIAKARVRFVVEDKLGIPPSFTRRSK